MTYLTPTSSQTIGPFWHLIDSPDWADLTRFGAEGERIEVFGTVRDGAGALVTDACVEIWQSDPPADAHFSGFGRCATTLQGMFRFITLKPGPVRGRGNTTQAPHLAICIFARGLLHHVVTRAYFEGEPLNETDPVLQAVPPARRSTLIARHADSNRWQLDITLQGADETVFFEV